MILLNEKLEQSNKIKTLMYNMIDDDNVLTHEMLVEVKKYCEKVLISDF